MDDSRAEKSLRLFTLTILSPTDVSCYYRAAIRALRFVENRRPTGRRFGTEADARWAALRGDLATADRVDLLVRDANAEWPGAFGARAVFHLTDVAEDDPFGAHWLPLDPVDGEDLWRSCAADPPPATLGSRSASRPGCREHRRSG